MNLSLSEQLTFITGRIECEIGPKKTSVGTGFFFDFGFDGDKIIPVIVTNRHVIKGAKQGVFQLTRANDEGDPIISNFEHIRIGNFEPLWIPHPDANVDLCIMPLGPLLHSAQEKSLRFFYRSFNESLIPSEQALAELTALEEILMIGYPVGIWDSANNMPVFRKGITATHPNLNYEGRQEFLIDAACFPGSSGSPVLLYNLGTYTNRQGGTVIGTRMHLLGILYAGPQYSVEGDIEIVPVPTEMKPIPVSRIPINLGLVIKARRLLDFKPILAKLAGGG